MAWIDVPDDLASPELERLTEAWRRRGEQVPPVIAVLKARPAAFEAVLRLNYALTFGASSLGRVREELLAVWVSALNRCSFCLCTHARYLEQVWPSSTRGELIPLLRKLVDLGLRASADSTPVALVVSELATLPSLSAGDSALLAFATELTCDPSRSSRAGFERLKDAGFAEAEILDAVLVAGCFALMNRLANGTGVALDPSKYDATARLLGEGFLTELRAAHG